MTRPTEAFGTALTRTRHVLFQPFELARYVALGFCMWLFRLGSAGGGAAWRSGGWSGGRGSVGGAEMDPDAWRRTFDAVLAWGPLLVALAATGLVVGVTVWAAVLYLQSRGAFMIIDGIVRDRGAVREAWKAWAVEAGALFRFRAAVVLGAFAVSALGMAGAGLGVWATWHGSLQPVHIAMLGGAGAACGLVVLAAAIADGCANEFVAPLMYARRYGVRAGFTDLWAYARGDVGGFALYLVLRLAAAIAVGVLTAVLAVLTCGLAMVPFLGTLLLLPALVFVRAFGIDFVAQLSDDLSGALHPATSPAAAA